MCLKILKVGKIKNAKFVIKFQKEHYNIKNIFNQENI